MTIFTGRLQQVCHPLKQASAGMSSQRWHMGKGLGSIPGEPRPIKVFAS